MGNFRISSDFDTKLLIGTPVNADNATGVLSIEGTVADGEKVVIGDDIYEFDTDDSVEEGNIKVDVSDSTSASDAVTALISAITGNDNSLVTAEKGTGDTVNLTAKVAGTLGNSINTTATMENGSFSKGTLENGVNGTIAPNAGIWYVDDTCVYITTAINTVSDKNWYKITLESIN